VRVAESAVTLTVELPGGGHLVLQDQPEVDLWNTSAERYIDDYGITKQNDLVLLGAILAQHLTMYRAQRALNDPKLAKEAQNTIIKAGAEIRELEKALGIDKKTREAGGQHTVTSYLVNLKRAAHEKGVRIAERTKAYEAFMMDMRWRIRLLRNGDPEDRQYHGISERSIIEWAEKELAELEEADRLWAHQKGQVFVGRV
jgi:hypothetical protein